MVVYLNGEFVPEAQARVSVFDRAFLYGDSLFETMRVCNGRIFRWNQHLDRFTRSVEALQFCNPVPPADLRRAARQLLEVNAFTDGVLRLTLTRGVGPRGYSPRDARSPTLVMSLHEAPLTTDEAPHWRMITSSMRLVPADRLAAHKTGSKLFQITARLEAEAAGADEALLLNTNGEVAEGAGGNVFWVRGPVIYTSPTAVGVLPGITRAVILEICAAHNFIVKKRLTKVEMVKTSEAMFLTNCARGIVEVAMLDDHPFPGNELVGRLRRLYTEVVHKECGLGVPTPMPATAS